MARPTKGLAHVDDLPGDPEQKHRLKVVLATLSGELLVDEACDELDLGPTQFAHVRRRVLLAALGGLTPRPPGRPRRVAEVSPEEVGALRQRVAELERELATRTASLELSATGLGGARPKSGARRKIRKATPS